MPDIKQLPSGVVNKIAAGEVIERPASVVKELVENSLDAGARRIDVTIGKGGSEQIVVADDGCGISADQLNLAIASHATSKLRDAEDLFNVQTLGFRGEALASIAEVSQFRIRSRTNAETAGAEIEVNGGQAAGVVPCGCPIGTSIEVRNLFFNTPVRRKFMRTVQTEMSHITEALHRLALPHPDVHFSLTHNQRQVYDLPPVSDWRDRIGTLFGRDVADGLIPVSTEESAIRIAGFVADPSQNRGNNRMQYLFLNGRHIKDRALSHALAESYRGLLMTGRYAIAFLRLDMPADLVDVNVHPTKLEVRFQDGGKLYSQLLNMIRSRFLASDLTAQARLSSTGDVTTGVAQAASRERAAFSAAASQYPDSSLATGPRSNLSDFKKFPSHGPSLGRASLSPPQPTAARQTDFELQFPSIADEPTDSAHSESTRVDNPNNGPTYSAIGAPAMQVYDRYLITETEEGVVVIDQHALHERILYEEIREKVLADNVEMQRLLVPEPVQLTATESTAVLENRETLIKLGVEIESFGNDTVLISAYPAMLANLNPSEVVRNIAERLLNSDKGVQRRDILDELLHMISCKAAIKAGDRLTSEEIQALLESRATVQDAHHCPHGRPTALVFSRDELDRRFKRI